MSLSLLWLLVVLIQCFLFLVMNRRRAVSDDNDGYDEDDDGCINNDSIW